MILHMRSESSSRIVAPIANRALERLLIVMRFHMNFQMVAEKIQQNPALITDQYPEMTYKTIHRSTTFSPQRSHRIAFDLSRRVMINSRSSPEERCLNGPRLTTKARGN